MFFIVVAGVPAGPCHAAFVVLVVFVFTPSYRSISSAWKIRSTR